MNGLARSLTLRLALLLAVLLLGYGVVVALLGARFATAREAETLQRLSHGLARHIVENWPTAASVDAAAGADRVALLRMLNTVNPAVQVYLLDVDGRVAHYIGEPGMVRTPQVDLDPVRRFLAGAALPLFGTDPMSATDTQRPRLFSAAMFAPRPGDSRPPGYLYIVLDSPARERQAALATPSRLWQGLASIVGLSLIALLLVGALALARLTRPLQQLAARMRGFNLAGPPVPDAAPAGAIRGDEVQQIAATFEAMAGRIQDAHREETAALAHDLRTPLTALHGHLEALAVSDGQADRRQRLVLAALQQSDKVRRLSQQLFELATLRAAAPALQRERFRIDELVSDAVQKFELGDSAVTLAGPAPPPLLVDGDLQLIDRALTNLIDNAVRHAPGETPVRVRLECHGPQVHVVVEDHGPGLPEDLHRHLQAGTTVREATRARCNGGGLGLAIAQRIAELHGGSLRPLPAPGGGTRLCLSLPRA